MKAWWTRHAARIDALSLRERAFLLVTIVLACAALADQIWLAPAQKAHSQLKQRMDKQSAELQRLGEELKVAANKPSPLRLMRDEMASIQSATDELDRTIFAMSNLNAGDAPIMPVLEQFLRKHKGLTLVGTTTLLQDKPQVAAGTTQGVLPAGLSRTGLELTVSGAFEDLVGLIQNLEKALPNLRWGRMHLKSDTLPPQLTVQVFVMGVQQ